MQLDEIFDYFCQEAPLPLLARATLERAFEDEQLDAIFRQNASRQYEGDLLFSALVRLMLPVSCGIRPSINAAFQRDGESIAVSLTSIYNKMQGIEMDVSRALVRDTSRSLWEVAGYLKADLPVPFPGYENRILDGNHLEASDHRIKETRRKASAPLPGLGLVVLDPATRMALDYIPCEDAHAQERSLLPRLIDDLEAGQVWIGDRNFCASAFLWEIHNSDSFFVVRKHAGNVRLESRGQEKQRGRTETGQLFEEAVDILDDFGGRFRARRIRLKLEKKTRNGDSELVILSNLPREISAKQIAEGYRQRWTIEAAFGEIRRCLNGEINGLGYPKAALFSFSAALLSFNVLSLIATAIRSAHGPQMQDEFSTQQAAEDIGVLYGGVVTILTDDYWKEHYGDLSARAFAQKLKQLARCVDVRRYKKAKRRPRAPTPKRKHNRNQPHVATARLIEQRKKKVTA